MATTNRASVHRGARRSRSLPMAAMHGALLSLVMGVAFLFFFAFLLSRTSDPSRLFPFLSWGSTLLLSFFGGMHAGRLHKASGSLCGLSVGTVIAFLFLLTALIIGEGKLPLLAIPLYLVIMAAATVGGMLATREKRRRRRH